MAAATSKRGNDKGAVMGKWETDDRLLDPSWYVTPEYKDVFRRLRDEDPIHWTEDDSYGKHHWTISRYDDVKQFLTNHEQLSNRWDTRIPATPKRYTPEERFAMGFDTSMARNDPPIHDLYRRPVNKHFSVPAIKKLTGDVSAIVDEIFAEAREKGEVDLVDEIAGELPARVVLRMIGVPESDWNELRVAAWRWLSPADDRYLVDGDPVKTSQLGQQALLAYCAELALARRQQPKDDFATVIGQIRIDDDPLTVHEMRNYMAVIIGGGLETTRSAASLGLLKFIKDRDQAKLLREDPSLAPSAVAEVLRWGSPVRSKFRVASTDFEWHGKEIRTGDWVVGLLASAHWDERKFSDPESFDIRRNPNPHLMFGEGIHQCLGRNLARLELATLFSRFVAEFPDAELSGPTEYMADRIMSTLRTQSVRLNASVPAAL